MVPCWLDSVPVTPVAREYTDKIKITPSKKYKILTSDKSVSVNLVVSYIVYIIFLSE